MTESSSSPSPALPSALPPPAPTPRRRAWAARLLPFIPILLSLSAAFAYRYYEASQIPVAPELGMIAPDFSLRDMHNEPDAPYVTLSSLVKKGPVILLFHRSLGCSHCYIFLSSIKDEIDNFNKAGLQVLAISSDDSPGAGNPDFPFPLLYDPDYQIALTYGLFTPDDALLYGVFIVDQNRQVRFVSRTLDPLDAIPEFLDLGRKLQQP